jgi:hypothetical protein
MANLQLVAMVNHFNAEPRNRFMSQIPRSLVLRIDLNQFPTDNLQIQGNRIAVPLPRELHPFRSYRMV